MKLKEFSELPLGIYLIYWKSGGSSLAAIGNDEHGHRWLAPCNWVRPLEWDTATNYESHVRGIKKAVFLRGRP